MNQTHSHKKRNFEKCQNDDAREGYKKDFFAELVHILIKFSIVEIQWKLQVSITNEQQISMLHRLHELLYHTFSANVG